MANAQTFVVNPAISGDDIHFQITLRLSNLQAMLGVHCEGSAGYLNLAEHDSKTVTAYLDAIKLLVDEVDQLVDALTGCDSAQRPAKDEAIALMRDLFTRLYTLGEYHMPRPDGRKTKAEATKALDGIYELANNIQAALGIGDVALWDESEMEMGSIDLTRSNKEGGRDGD